MGGEKATGWKALIDYRGRTAEFRACTVDELIREIMKWLRDNVPRNDWLEFLERVKIKKMRSRGRK